MKLIRLFLIWLLLSMLSLPGEALPAEHEDDPIRNGIRLSELQTHPVRSIQFWRQMDQSQAPDAHIGPAPAGLIEYLRIDNAFQGYSEQPVPASADSEFIRDVKMAVSSLPGSVKVITERMLFYIALVRNLGGGTGYTDFVADDDGSVAGGFIVLDEGALDRTANAWASWKEGSAFQPSAEQSLDVRIEEPGNDTRVNAIRYILLHELGHVIDAVLGVTQVDGGNAQNVRSGGFYGLSWIYPPSSQGTVLPGDAVRSRFDTSWPERETLAFYTFGNSKHSLSEAPSIYKWLRQTNFPTLYAATSPANDFAESFANYVHVALDKRPFDVRLKQGEHSADLLGSCWTSPRCASKRMVVEHLLARAAQLPKTIPSKK
ncbi:MAG: hypothetical protein PVJ33_12665 [Lysobacterales bacterium]|jgi:hypothetical protein